MTAADKKALGDELGQVLARHGWRLQMIERPSVELTSEADAPWRTYEPGPFITIHAHLAGYEAGPEGMVGPS